MKHEISVRDVLEYYCSMSELHRWLFWARFEYMRFRKSRFKVALAVVGIASVSTFALTRDPTATLIGLLVGVLLGLALSWS